MENESLCVKQAQLQFEKRVGYFREVPHSNRDEKQYLFRLIIHHQRNWERIALAIKATQATQNEQAEAWLREAKAARFVSNHRTGATQCLTN